MQRKIYLAGGCFWGVEAFFKQIVGVITTDVGYANGNTKNPSYQDVCRGSTGFVETIELVYDDEIITLTKILDYFFMVVDPTQLNKQGHDIGSQYRNGVFFVDVSDKKIISDYIEKLKFKYQEKIVTEVLPLENYFSAEEYHQDYLDKNPEGYCHIDLNILKK